MEKIALKVVKWIIGKYLPTMHLSRNPTRKKGEPCIVVPDYEKEGTND